MTSTFLSVCRLLAFVAWTLLLLPPYLVLLAVGWRGYIRYVRAYFRMVNRLVGFDIVVRGRIETTRPALFIANHASYLDIIVLGSLIDANFVAKSEVANWPGFGFLSRIAQTVFVDRKRGGTARERDLLQSCLNAGRSLILFPEGTSNDGNRVLPFKSSLFAVAEDAARTGQILPVQPVSVAYTRLDGLPLTRAMRQFYAWYGDMTLAGHLPAALGLGRVTIEVTFHPVVTIADFPDRKALANHCHDVISHGLVTALAGRVEA
ncbi:lysophospholipid acyltransferase family protein [Magnetospirillum moscoviense]|uniref:Acyl-phosphate glycerol 3-phosphate acyltransferase n=1 Tax=Magnetospirillum moscoviense TaxID=1437059 RepID=A0A178N1B2_9PROT|nr:lysophospholipid acyltransferase family protein [Magnetospirillum moscoviense]OAN65495.1 acyl-phosphate glycerol 3-phosphate acyltransferase [Magnetospirillum moscoviense]